MAELPDRRQQNQAFLQELERQRLNKDCLRIIDLRGKVPGECQAYEFGGRVHYLDDRAYLLVKQLLNRFEGRYTVGVYEALFKALRQLTPAEAAPLDSAGKLPVLALDQTIERAEARVIFSTPVALQLEDVLYHGHTVDIALNAIRVSLRRSYSLQAHDRVTVAFPDFQQQDDSKPTRRLRYQIIKLDHDSHHTTAVLRREAEQDDDFAGWLRDWMDDHLSQRQLDVDNEIVNLQTAFYQRLWLSNLGTPLLWLGQAERPEPLRALHLAPACSEQIRHWGVGLQQLPLPQLAEGATALITAFNREHSFTADLAEATAVNRLINWHLSEPDSHLLLLDAQPVAFDQHKRQQALSLIQELDAGRADAFQSNCAQIQRRVCITDLTQSMRQLAASARISSQQLQPLQTRSGDIDWSAIRPDTLDAYIQREKARFYIRTPVTISAGDRLWSVQTLDASADGLAVNLPAEAGITLNQRLVVNFERWQTLTDKVALSAIPYQVKNLFYWQGMLRLGLQRIKSNCPESLNQFFDWVIKQNQAKLSANQDDRLKTAESRVYSAAVLPGLRRIPVFLGTDNQAQRQIQLVGTTRNNDAAELKGLWLALAGEQLRLGDMLRQSGNGSYQTTLYAYADRNGHWTLAFEQDFQGGRDKSLFIQRGLAATSLRVFSAQLTPLKAQDAEQQADLMAELMQWRSQRAHRVSAMRQQLSHLLGLLELSDITAVIKTFYQP